MDDKNRVDLPCFLLFEATDDNSEVLDSSKSTTFSKFYPEDDSDAMSCSYDEAENIVVHSIDHDLSVGFLEQDSRFEEKGANNIHYVESGREDEDVDDGVVDQDIKQCADHKMMQLNKKMDEKAAKKKVVCPKKNVVCLESCEEMKRRREEDKLFWKSCLES